jgi:hypothetical protein
MSVQTNIKGADGYSVEVDSSNRLKVIGNTFDDYHISDMDIASDTKYYGYEDKEGNWHIQREITSTGTYRYASGSSDYSTAWTNRASQVYNYFSVEF